MSSKIFDKEFKWDNKEYFIPLLPRKDKVRFALFCAKQVAHLSKDSRVSEAISTVEMYLEDKATSDQCAHAAAHAAATAAHAAAYAVHAAAAAAAHAVHAAAHAVHAAAHAVHAAELKQEQLSFLRDLLILNLSEEDRNNWLLIACF